MAIPTSHLHHHHHDYPSTSKRLKPWGLLAIFSAVTLGAICEATKSEKDAYIKYTILTAAITLIIAPIFIINSKWNELVFPNQNYLNGTFFEVFLSTCLIICWGISLGFINIRDIGGGAMYNANIYYFSWGAFIVTVVLWGDICGEYFYISASPRDLLFRGSLLHPRFVKWVLLAASTIIVMTSASSDYKDDCNHDNCDSSYCRRLLYGIMIGAGSAFLSFFMMFLLHQSSSSSGTSSANNNNLHSLPDNSSTLPRSSPFLQIEINICALICISYAFGVTYLTGADGPATSIGNLYYFTWISFLIAVYIFMECFDDVTYFYRQRREHASASRQDRQTNLNFDSFTCLSDEDDDEENNQYSNQQHQQINHPIIIQDSNQVPLLNEQRQYQQQQDDDNDSTSSPFFECGDESSFYSHFNNNNNQYSIDNIISQHHHLQEQPYSAAAGSSSFDNVTNPNEANGSSHHHYQNDPNWSFW